jgi:uncharacterized damage-inducible protein DinB
MKIREMTQLFDYNDWANARILQAAARVSAEQYAAPAGLSYGGLRGTLVHTYEAEHSWRMRCQHDTWGEELTEADIPSLAELHSRWQAEEAALRAYLGGLSDADLERIVRYEIEGGVVRERVLWHCLVHVVNHGTQHRSEAAILLTNYGQSPGDLDFTVYLNSQLR